MYYQNAENYVQPLFVEFIALAPQKTPSDDTIPTTSFTPGAAPNISEIFLVNNASP